MRRFGVKSSWLLFEELRLISENIFQSAPRGSMLKKPGPGGSGEVLLPHGTEWNALKVREAAQATKTQEALFQVMATCIFYRNGRLSGRDNEVLARSKRQHYYKPRILGSKKNYGLKFTLHLAFFYCFTFYAGFPHWMAFGRWEGVRSTLRPARPPSSPSQPWAKKAALAWKFTGTQL